MKKVILVSAIGIGVIAAGAGSMLAMNSQIDNAIERLKSASNDRLTVSVKEDSGSFTDRHIQLSFVVEENYSTFEFLVDNDITKRPWGATIEHSVRLGDFDAYGATDREQEIFKKYFVDQSAITGSTSISVTGSYQSNFTSVSVQENQDSLAVSIEPLSVEISGDRSGHVLANGLWNGLVVKDEGDQPATLTVEPVSFSLDGEYIAGTIFLGDQSIEGQGLNFELADDWNSVSIKSGNYSLTSTGSITDNRYNGGAYLKADSIFFMGDAEQLDIQDIAFSFEISGFEEQNLVNILEQVNDMEASGLPSAVLMNELNTMLQNGFTISIPESHATFDDGDLSLAGSFILPENTIADTNNPLSMMGLLPMLEASMDLTMDSSIAYVPQLNEVFTTLQQSGSLVEVGDKYESHFSLLNGKALLNGEQMQLPM